MTTPATRPTLWQRLLPVTLWIYQMDIVKQYFIIKNQWEATLIFVFTPTRFFLLKYDASSGGKLNFKQLSSCIFFLMERFRENSAPWLPEADTSDTDSRCCWVTHCYLSTTLSLTFLIILLLFGSNIIYQHCINCTFQGLPWVADGYSAGWVKIPWHLWKCEWEKGDKECVWTKEGNKVKIT